MTNPAEFNLSEKMKWAYSEEGFVNGLDVIPVNDVKEFIKRLKEDIALEFEGDSHLDWLNIKIDKLAGEKLK